MQFKAYDNYKPTDVDWLKEIPLDWNFKRLKTSAHYKVSNVNKVPDEEEVPIRLCNYTDVYYNEFITSDMEFMETTASPEEMHRFHLHENDVVITKDSEEWDDIAIPALIVNSAPDLICGYHLAIIRPDSNKINGRFLFRSLQSSAINHQFQIAANGVTRYGMPKSSIGEARIIIPPIDQQNTIADFLDCETAKISTLVTKKKELIKRLNEKRVALIIQTVTCGLPPVEAQKVGLNPHPAMKPSKIEWIGDVPEHWEVSRLRRVVFSINNGTSETQIDEVDGMLPVTRIETISKGYIDYNAVGYVQKFNRANDYRLKKGDLLFSHINSLQMIGNCAIYNEERPLFSGMNLLRITPSNNVYSRWLWYLLISDGFRRTISARAKPAINQASLTTNQIKDMHIVVPPFHEQRIIADFLDSEIQRLEELKKAVENVINKLQEYRIALITAAVTGKIDVRGVNLSLQS